jgi:aconitase A
MEGDRRTGNRNRLHAGAGGIAVFHRRALHCRFCIGDFIASNVNPEIFKRNYANVFADDSRWNQITSPDGTAFAWDEASAYIKNPYLCCPLIGSSAKHAMH